MRTFSFGILSLALQLFPLLVASAPVEDVTPVGLDTSSHCGQWDVINAGNYTMYLDQWGKSGATTGSQCANFVSLSGNTVAWKTTWTWNGGNGVKSFTNMQQNAGVNRQLSAIKSMPVRSIFLCRHLVMFTIAFRRCGTGPSLPMEPSLRMLPTTCSLPTLPERLT